LNEAKRAEFVEAAVSLVGIPYHHLGRNPKISLDCAGLLAESARMVGNELVGAMTQYNKQPRPDVLESELSRYAQRMPDDDERIGLVYLLRRRSGLRAAHFAIRINEHQVVHALAGVGVCISGFEPDLILSRWELV